MKKLPIVNMTARQMLVDFTATKLRIWAHDPLRIGGLGADDIVLGSFGDVRVVTSHAVAVAINHVLDGAQPGTYAGSMAAWAERMDEQPDGWKRFVRDVRKEARR